MGKLTVFVLGAGASIPFQYPSGNELVRRVLALHPDDRSCLTKPVLMPFRDALYKSGAYSVDAFLERNPKYVNTGRLAIANVLIECEQYGNLWMDTVTVGTKEEPVDNWYKYLFNRIVQGVPFEKVCEWPIRFITFNYDRSLEHFLFEATKNQYGKTDEEVAAALAPTTIVHLHGHLGLLPWQSGDGFRRPYNPDRKADEVGPASKQIQIVHDAIPGSDEFNLARQFLLAADQIWVLGFGYNRTNVDRLGLVKDKTAVEPVGTWVGLTSAERASINAKGCNVKFWTDYGGEGIVEFLKNNQAFLDREWTA